MFRFHSTAKNIDLMVTLEEQSEDHLRYPLTATNVSAELHANQSSSCRDIPTEVRVIWDYKAASVQGGVLANMI